MTELSGSGPEAKDMKLVRTKGHAGEIFQVRKVVVSLSKIDFITKKAHGKPVCLFCVWWDNMWEVTSIVIRYFNVSGIASGIYQNPRSY